MSPWLVPTQPNDKLGRSYITVRFDLIGYVIATQVHSNHTRISYHFSASMNII